MNGALAGLIILVLGDSHMADSKYLITPLHDALENAGATVHSYGMCGASAEAWLERTTVSCGRAERHERAAATVGANKQEYTWTLGELVQKHHPNLVIVEAADAMAGYGSPQMPKPWIYQQVHALVGRITAANASCIWVGPIWGAANSPYHKDDARVQELSQLLAQTVAPCGYVNSLQFARPGQWPTTDGQHLTPAGYQEWGRDIAGAVVQLASQGRRP
jgi:hypothetical protein